MFCENFLLFECCNVFSENRDVIRIWYVVRVSETLFTVATSKPERIEGACGFEGTSFLLLLLLLNLKETFSEPKISKYFKHSKKKKLKNEKKKKIYNQFH